MNDFSEGDLIEATKGDTVVRSRIRLANDGNTYLVGDLATGIDLFSYLHNGFKVTLIEKAAPGLPTKPGFYSDRKGDAWKLADNGFWYDSGYVNGASMRNRKYIATLAPFTRLEPVADTAKKVLDRIRNLNRFDDNYWDRVEEVAKDFGVKND